jgi:hypothetical protein
LFPQKRFQETGADAAATRAFERAAAVYRLLWT